MRRGVFGFDEDEETDDGDVEEVMYFLVFVFLMRNIFYEVLVILF